MNAPTYNFAYLDEQTKRMIRRAILKAIAIPGYQVPFAARIRQETNIPTGAVGLITEPAQADGIIAGGAADVVLIARASLRDPYFPRRAAQELGATIVAPVQYQRAW